MIRTKRRDTTVTDLRPFGLVEAKDRLIESLPERVSVEEAVATSEGASISDGISDGQPLGDDHVRDAGCWLNVGPHSVPEVVQRVGGHPKDLQDRPYRPSGEGLFDGISEQRKRRLLGIRIGGKPLFDRNGKCVL